MPARNFPSAIAGEFFPGSRQSRRELLSRVHGPPLALTEDSPRSRLRSAAKTQPRRATAAAPAAAGSPARRETPPRATRSSGRSPDNGASALPESPAFPSALARTSLPAAAAQKSPA